MDQDASDSQGTPSHCPNCGAELIAREPVGQEQGRCPACGQRVTGPDTTATPSWLYDLQLLDVPAHASNSSTGDSEEEYRRLQRLHGVGPPERESEAPRRKLPWVIDIFLYPANRVGLSILLISVGVPFLLWVTAQSLLVIVAAFGPMLVFWVLSIVLHWGVFAALVLYVNWYFCECIRDSADGGIRAADTTGTTPGLGEILGQALRVTVSTAVCMAPALVYLNEARGIDKVFWVLFGVGGFFIPMALLAVVMFDGLHGLNPTLLLRSIVKTVLQYSALAALCYVPCLLAPVAGYLVVNQSTLGYVLLFLTYYLLLILAHLLGGFYRRNEEKLQWDAG